MTRPAVMIVIDAAGQRGFIDVSHDWDPTQEHTRVLLADGGQAIVPTASLERQVDGTLRCPQALAALAQGQPTVVAEDVATIPVIEETLHVDRERRETGRVRIHKHVQTRQEQVEVPLLREQVQVERVAIDREVDGPVAIRQEGDTTIIPVLEEVLVVEKRWILREELHVRVHRSIHNESRTVSLRTEQVTVEKLSTAEPDAPQQPPQHQGPPSTPRSEP